MNRVSTLIIGALFAIAAVEFGLLGASAAGITGGNDDSLPPVSERLGVLATPTPLPAVKIELTAPQYIDCATNDVTIVTAYVTTAGDQSVSDGTEVAFTVPPPGSVDPSLTTTTDGYTNTMVRAGDRANSGSVTVMATSGFADASISIPCAFATPTMLAFVTVTPTPCDGPCPPTSTPTYTITPCISEVCITATPPPPTRTPTPCSGPCPATPTPFSPPSCDSEVQFCPTVAPNTPIPPLSPPSVDATGMDIRANPLTIECAGSQSSTVTVRIFDANGVPVPDGTFVSFSPYNGNADPWYSYTYDGYASTQVSFYGDIFPYGPNLIVESGLLQVGIRIRCTPQSDGCPTWPESPPPSPGCEEPPPPSPPYPCNPSPGSGPLSPPCEPEQPCAVSPPSVSPSCEEPPASPPTAFELQLDCDTGASGIQSYCLAAPSAPRDVAVVFTNLSGSDKTLAAFNFTVNNADTATLSPLPGVESTPPQLNDNPDFNEGAISEPGWTCLPVITDLTPGGPSSESLLSCFNGAGSVSIADGESLVLGVVHYATGTTSNGSAFLSIEDGAFYNASFIELGSCNPTI